MLICKCSKCSSSLCHAKIACYETLLNNEYFYGCFDDLIQIIQCNKNIFNIACCKQDYCNFNKSILPNLNDTSVDVKAKYMSDVSLIISSILCLFVILSSVFVYFYCTKYKTRQTYEIGTVKKNQLLVSPHTNTINSTKSTFIPTDATSGSGHAELIQRTIARDLRIDYSKSIGEGRYGVVWKAKWNDEHVAVKSFFSMHEASWLREIDIYHTCMIRHENILGFIAADIIGNNNSISMLLVTEYHELGSLYDYLQMNTIDFVQLKSFAYSIINGLNHLHTEILGNKYKPIVAHRDLKSKNILLKSRTECCIADFGLSVRYDSQKNHLDAISSRLREGSHRFMAPECLNETLDMSSIDEIKRTDVYSYALVLWELVKRYNGSDSNENVEVYEPPFYEYLSDEPSLDQMKDIVCEKNLRPTISESKLNDKNLISIIAIMKECWQNEPIRRLQALRIKKNLNRLI